MSNLVEKKYPIDMSEGEIEALEKFVRNGLPGIATGKPELIKQAMELYFNGASYDEISQRIGIKKVIITYHSTKEGWYDLKIEMLKALASTIQTKAEIAHVRSLDLLTDLMAVLEDYYRKIIDNYRRSKMPSIIESADMENLKVYMKCMEQIQKFRFPVRDSKQPLMGLNLPEGGTLKKIDDNTIEVSPQNPQSSGADLSKVLEALADLRREREGNNRRKDEEKASFTKKSPL